MKFIIATIKSWNVEAARELAKQYNCKVLCTSEELTVESVKAYGPDYIFFPHWSWVIPEELHTRYPCVIFHMTDVPYGRGGSPLQNLVLLGIKHTKISAIKAEKAVDAGPVYLKRDLCIEGTAEEVLRRATSVIFEMIEHIVETRPEPVPQEGDVTVFKRRTPEQSELPREGCCEQILSFIRMLDGEGYPPAFIRFGKFRITFTRAAMKGGAVLADARIELLEK